MKPCPFGDQIKFGSYFPIFNILTFPLITNSPQLFNITTPTFEILLWPISKLIFKFFISFLLNDHYTLMLIPPSSVSINYHFLFKSPKYYYVTFNALIHPYIIMYCTLSRDGVLHYHTPNPGPTRLADPNRFPGRETTYWDSLPDFFF